MEALLGFDLDLWDYLTFLTLMLCVVALIATWLFLAGLPGRIALARKHPEAEAVKYLGYAGLLPTVYPWMQALIWAFKPTDIVDIRRFPREEAIETDKEIARLRGTPDSAREAVKESTQESVADAQAIHLAKTVVQGSGDRKS
ncbi:MAG: DUF3302 domain-containing protein [Candidatus Accumulibacter sp.]|uniref:DUF3302 domain-containing protein n=1 Tax=Candidatus Accumulibacter proximus TaxID=2954385 RepID=A0A935Q001_9PROT|nr:DUF3302 domain-containing protein [Candidatus Accumulibacter proximus]